jgi:hypothetical protein
MTKQVSGTIIDLSGAPVPNAVCTVTPLDALVGQEGGARAANTRTYTANGSGVLTIPAIKIGKYSFVAFVPATPSTAMTVAREGVLSINADMGAEVTLEAALLANAEPVTPSQVQQALDAATAAAASETSAAASSAAAGVASGRLEIVALSQLENFVYNAPTGGQILAAEGDVIVNRTTGENSLVLASAATGQDRTNAEGVKFEIINKDTLPYVDNFYLTDWDQAFSDAFDWAEKTGVPLALNPQVECVLSEALVFRSGIRLVNPFGLLNPATRTLSPPRQAGLAKISLAAGFSGDAIVFPGEAYNSGAAGIFFDLRNQVAGRGVVFSDEGYTTFVFRPNCTLQDSHVLGAHGDNIEIEEYQHEARLLRVYSSDSQTGSGVLWLGGDCHGNEVWASNNALDGHRFIGTPAFRGWGIEGWRNDRANVAFEGSVRGTDIYRLISDDAGEHGVDVRVNASGGVNNVNIYGIRVGGSSRLSSGNFNDLNIDTALVGGRVSLALHGGKIGNTAAPSGWMTRAGIGMDAFPNNQFRELFGIRVNDVEIITNSINEAIDAGARNGILFSGGSILRPAGPQPLTTNNIGAIWNLLENGDFVTFETDGSGNLYPHGWARNEGPIIAQVTSGAPSGDYGVSITAGANVGSGLRAHIPAAPLVGRMVTFSGWARNATGEVTANNTRIRLVSGANSAEYIVPSDGRDHYWQLSISIPSGASFVELLATPASSVAASGRELNLARCQAVIGGQPAIGAGGHPADLDHWQLLNISPFSGILAALDLRFGRRKFKLTPTTTVDFVGIANRVTQEELFLQFENALATIKFSFGTLKRADGLTTDYTPTAGQMLRVIWNGQSWVFFLP